MRPWLAIAALELRQVLRSRTLSISLTLLLCAGIAALYAGTQRVARERELLAQREPFLREQAAYLRHKHAEDLGLLLYYLAMPTEQTPGAWTPLATGLRDVHPFSQHLRVLGLVPQAYASELGSPLAQLTGSFDYAFVVTFLLPLLLIALGYDVASRDEVLGTELLLRSQPVRRSRVIALRLLLRSGVVWLTTLVLLALAMAIARLPLDQRVFWWLLALTAYVAFWTLLIWLVAALGRSSGWNAIALVGSWIGMCVLLPAAANALLMSAPTEAGVMLTLRQREVLNAGWDKPKRVTMEPFYERRPEWRETEIPEDTFSWPWYWAMQEVGDAAVEREVHDYRAALEMREHNTQQAAFLLPPLAVQRALSRLAGTDLLARLAYQDSVASYHETLKQQLYPLIFGRRPVSALDFAELPRHHFERSVEAPELRELASLLALVAFLLCVATRAARRFDAA